MKRRFRIRTKSMLMMLAAAICFLPVVLLAGNYTIDHYEFGKIIVNGITYEKDIVIMPDGTIRPGPEDMHYVLSNELEEIINTPGIRTLVIGTGDDGNGRMRKNLIKDIKAKGIILEMMLTKDAVKMLNQTPKDGLVAMLHLNC
ncbi:MAG: hypothetical protein KKG47_16850 [Proteobacteria bacterium]|nr:hypothetical protein [Pseudomonadota bacterium]MBU1736514.1 hypothetical protein [Pseudomonadota bacterium]